MTDAVAEPADCVDLVVAHGDDVTEVQHRPDRRGSGDAIEGGLKNEKFTKIEGDGVLSRIITDEGGKTITEIRTTERGKKQ